MSLNRGQSLCARALSISRVNSSSSIKADISLRNSLYTSCVIPPCVIFEWMSPYLGDTASATVMFRPRWPSTWRTAGCPIRDLPRVLEVQTLKPVSSAYKRWSCARSKIYHQVHNFFSGQLYFRWISLNGSIFQLFEAEQFTVQYVANCLAGNDRLFWKFMSSALAYFFQSYSWLVLNVTDDGSFHFIINFCVDTTTFGLGCDDTCSSVVDDYRSSCLSLYVQVISKSQVVAIFLESSDYPLSIS